MTEEVLFNGYSVSIWGDGKVLEADRGYGRLPSMLTATNCAPKSGPSVNFVVIITTDK